MKKLLLTIFLVSLAVNAYPQGFVPGEIIIGFKASVDEVESVKILGEFNLELKEGSFAQYRHTYYFKTAKHGNANMESRLDESQLFSLVDIPLDDKGIDMSSDALFAYAKLTTTQNDVTKLVASLRGVSIKSTETTSISLVVTVPNGKENDTAKKVMKHKKIEYAELNYLTSVDEESAKSRKACFYLNNAKVQSTIMPVAFTGTSALGDNGSILLYKNGLFQGDERLCQWSLNGGSGTKEQFSLDGGFAVPILDTSCEAPFTHEYTGVGFGDWYLTLCGTISGENLSVVYGGDEVHVSTKVLIQWSEYTPGEFPVKGDKGD